MSDEYFDLLQRLRKAENHFNSADANHIEAACYEMMAAEKALDAIAKEKETQK